MKPAALILLFPLLASAVSVRQTHLTTDSGTVLVQQIENRGPVRRPTLDEPEVIWHRNHAAGIFSSTAISASFAYSGSWLNDPREAARYEFDGDGSPAFTLLGNDWIVAAAPQGGLWAAANRDQTQNSSLYLLADSLSEPLWVFNLGQGGVVSQGGLQFSSDGLVLAAFISSNPPVRPRILLWDAQSADSTPVLTYEVPAGFGDYGRAMALSFTGEIIAFTAGSYLHIIESDGTVRDSINLQSSSDPLAVSSDGDYVMAGFPAIHTYRWSGGEYLLVWSFRLFNSYCSQALISPDGSYAVTCWYPSTYNRNYVRVHRLDTGFPVWWHYYRQGSGSYQDMVVDVDATADGSWFALASWGDQGNSNGEAVVFSRYHSEPYYQLDMPGSANSLSLSDDGRYLLAGGKHVHANQFGSGGDLYLVDLDMPTHAIPALADTVLCDTDTACVCVDTFHLTLLILNQGYAPAHVDSVSLRPVGISGGDRSIVVLDSAAFAQSILPRDTLRLTWSIVPCFAPVDFRYYEATAFFADTSITRQRSLFISHCESSGEPAPQALLPKQVAINSIYPNPFNSATRMEFELPASERASLIITDITGRIVRQQEYFRPSAGRHSVEISGQNLSSGIYFVNLQSGKFSDTQKIILIR